MSSPIEINPTGPHVAAAFLCTTVLTEASGTNTYVRVIDRFQQDMVGPAKPEPLPPLRASFTVVVFLRAGKATGPFEVNLRLQLPSGELLNPQVITVHLDEGQAVNLHVPTEVEFHEQGAYHLQVLIGGKLLAEIPFRVLQSFHSGGRA